MLLDHTHLYKCIAYTYYAKAAKHRNTVICHNYTSTQSMTCHQGFKSIKKDKQQQQMKTTSPLTRRDKDNDNSSSKFKRKKKALLQGICNGKWFTVVCHEKSLELHWGDASAARSRESAPVATVNRAVTTTTTERQPSPISQQWQVRNVFLLQNHFFTIVDSLLVINQWAIQPSAATQDANNCPTAVHSVASINWWNGWCA